MGTTLHFAGYSYNLEIVDLAGLILVVGLVTLILMAKLRGLRNRVEALEKHTNIQTPK